MFMSPSQQQHDSKGVTLSWIASLMSSPSVSLTLALKATMASSYLPQTQETFAISDRACDVLYFMREKVSGYMHIISGSSK
jgi:hypothetical protein